MTPFSKICGYDFSLYGKFVFYKRTWNLNWPKHTTTVQVICICKITLMLYRCKYLVLCNLSNQHIRIFNISGMSRKTSVLPKKTEYLQCWMKIVRFLIRVRNCTKSTMNKLVNLPNSSSCGSLNSCVDIVKTASIIADYIFTYFRRYFLQFFLGTTYEHDIRPSWS